ncbi:hypothetical protein [Kineococcus aurantiacus]|uniref:Uncharacterized protein n=1 Tax=Kineococcus aurantiacus TaxID=37633 RepID=A0A7Y9DN68_9ACTN|nr:hypothetical protein [Kineococcus aurantiacus]NYD23697.1 hypothetical protein [Kineococcus aurantiacus]
MHDLLLSALRPYGSPAEVSLHLVPHTRLWVTAVTPHRPSAAPLSVGVESPSDATGTDVAFTITVAHTWLEVDGLDEPLTWLRQLAEAVFAGHLQETGFTKASAVRIHTVAGLVEGGAWQLPLVRRLLPHRRFTAYADTAPAGTPSPR